MFGAYACSKHSNFLKVDCKNIVHGTVTYRSIVQTYADSEQYTHPVGGPVTLGRERTTSILTAAT